MTRRRTDVPATIRREASQRTEGERSQGEGTPTVLRSPMVRGREARRALLLAALVREGLIEVEGESTDHEG